MVIVKDSARWTDPDFCERCQKPYVGSKCPYCKDGEGTPTILAMDGAFEEAWDALSKAWYDEEDIDPYTREEDPELWEKRNEMPVDEFWDEIGVHEDAERSAQKVLEGLFPPKTLATRGKESINAILNLLGLRRPKQ